MDYSCCSSRGQVTLRSYLTTVFRGRLSYCQLTALSVQPSLQSSKFSKSHFFFKVCKSVHHLTIQINHNPDATVFQFIILTFIYSSTCFGRFLTHHQELNDCSGSLWFCPRIVVIVVLCSWSGRPASRPGHEHNTTITTI